MAETLAELIPAPKDQNMAWFCGEQLDMKTARGVSLGDMPPITPEDDTSQFGEARLIQLALFRFVGLEYLDQRKRWCCFEIGAGDGQTNSNTFPFRVLGGWERFLIEKTGIPGHPLICDWWTKADVLPPLLTAHLPNEPFTFGVIDIDGGDYVMWDYLVPQPPLMLIEYNPKRPPDHEYNPAGANYMEQQAGLNPIVRLGESKGYVPIGRTFCNVLFLDRKYCDGSQPGHS